MIAAMALAVGLIVAAVAQSDTCGVSLTSAAPVQSADVVALQGSTDPAALYHAALAYAVGKVVAQDCGRAAALLAKAAVSSGAAADALGEMYEAGRGVSQSDRDAARWYRTAYDRGDARGTYNLGRMMAEDRAFNYGVAASVGSSGPTFGDADVLHSTQRDWKSVANLWQISADKGDPLATYRLGQLYETGMGVPADARRALQLYTQAAAAGVPGAAESLKALQAKQGLGP